MNIKHVNEAITNIDAQFIAESIEQPAAGSSASRKPLRKLVVAAAAACLVLALSVTAYALNISGIRDLVGHTYYELPSEADQYIVPHSQIIEGDNWTCRVTESLTAGNTIMVALNITCDEDCILNGWMDTPSAEEIAQGIGSFAYAEQQGKTALFFGAVIHDGDAELSGYITSLDEIVSDREMNILLQRDKLTAEPISEAECFFDVREVRTENGQKVHDESDHLKFTVGLSESPVQESVVYTAVDGGPIPGLSFEQITIDRSVLGSSVTLRASVSDITAAENIGMLRCGEIEEFFNFHNSIKNGILTWCWSMAEIDNPDTLTVSIYGDPEAEQIGEVTFTRG